MHDPSGIPWFLAQLLGLALALLVLAWLGCRAPAIHRAVEGLDEELEAMELERPVEALPERDADPEC